MQIPEYSADAFGYLAFDSSSGVILAHGWSAFEAIQIADYSHPMSSIHVVAAGKAGSPIWAARMSYAEALLIIGPRQAPAALSGATLRSG